MAVRKKHLFKEDVRELGEYGQALGHPARVQILEVLAQESKCRFERLCLSLPLSRPTVSYHLGHLVKSGWVTTTEVDNGQAAGYQLRAEMIEAASSELMAFCRTLLKAA